MIIASKHTVLFLAKIAPLLGAALIVVSLQAGHESTFADIWRIGMSVALGVFVALVGAIYQNLNKRIEALEETKKDFVTFREYDKRHDDLKDQYDKRHEDLKEQLTRMEELLLKGNRVRP